MALYDPSECNHQATIYGPPTATPDGSGGTIIAWPTVRQADIPCSINTASASEVLRFAQMDIVVSHTVAILAELLTDGKGHRGDKIVADGDVYHVKGIQNGRAMDDIPAFVYFPCEQLLNE